MLIRVKILAALTLASVYAAGEQDAIDRLLDRIARQEQQFIEQLRPHSALLETYIQEIPAPDKSAEQALRDHYFLGRLDLSNGVNYLPIANRSEVSASWKRFLGKSRPVVFFPAGFAQMILPDADSLDRNRYHFEYVRREFVGEIRCLLFDVAPLDKKATGKFIGRIWVDDREMHIVRFNGTYTNSSAARQYFHFDSWRVNVAPGVWVPAFIYVEESQASEKGAAMPRFKAQTRLWSFNTAKSGRLDELASIAVEADRPLKDESGVAEISPLESQRSWERQAEINILERLEKAGLLAPAGPVDDVLNTVINNLIVTNNLNVQAAGRVLLTTPIETFSVGQTIVISRGLLDVLPDEASLAMVLSDELAHIALGHRTETHFAFSDQTMLDDANLLKRLQLARPPEEIAAAGAKAVEMLAKSPYHDKLSNAGLFLRALSSRAGQLPNLIRANLGNGLASGTTLVRMEKLAAQAPPLESEKLEQIAALPLGSRIRLDPWTNEVAMVKTKPVSLISARDKLPFEVTPFLIHLSRAGVGEGKQDPASSTSAQRQR